MRLSLVGALLVAVAAKLPAQAPGKFPPDSLINLKVIPKTTPVPEVVGMMRNFAGNLGVRCQYCHVGEEGMPLARFDFAKDEKRPKLVARQMMRMVEEINKRVDTLPHGTDHEHQAVTVTCATCHRGVSRPVPLFQLILDAATKANADSAIRLYRALRQRYYGRDAYDFGEGSLNTAALRIARANKPDDALAVLRVNEEQFPNSTVLSTFRGNINLMKGDTTAAATAFREALRRDSTNMEARGRLRDLGRGVSP
jgi:hypothetical protein